MFARILFVGVLASLVGCSVADHEPVQPPRANTAAAAPAGVAAISPSARAPGSQPSAVAHVIGFAKAPDRGSLATYPSQPPRQDGAYTWYRTDLSEAHALRAITTGTLAITVPSGETLDFRYERHVEHPSGDWTWVGRLQDGASSEEVVLTFGQKAVFGSVGQPGQAPLRLTMQGGVSWFVATDRAKIAALDNATTRPTTPDFLIPPKLANRASAPTWSTPPSTASLTSQSAGTTAANMVDVVLGYTTGFASALGGQSQAVTRLNNIVEVANQAYVNSQLDMRVRLVQSVQVSYPDNTSNQSALEGLTGFQAPSTETTPDPAFSALRAAREQYGADLVSLVRKFNTPENSGCGIAWLIGGGQKAITQSDEFFGYSVVSDGQDAGTDGQTYFCREETLAHELGHNMGSAHDRTAATENGILQYGAYPYSFGYKAGVGAGNFYTVMAYGDSGQSSYRLFSNPRITICGGYICGVPDQADNARSLERTAPIITTFRAIVVPVTTAGPASIEWLATDDINGDGRTDLLWRNYAAGQVEPWMMFGAARSRGPGFTLPAGYRILTSGDFNGDGFGDFIITSAARDLWMWLGTGTWYRDYSMGVVYASGWTPIGQIDINGDGKSDLLWRDAAGNLEAWLMNGPDRSRGPGVTLPTGYRILATGDFNGDRKADLMIAGPSRDLVMWFGNGASFTAQSMGAVYADGWVPSGQLDFNNDGRSDLLWRSASGQLEAWMMYGGDRARGPGIDLPAGSRVLSTGDFNGDHLADLLVSSAARELSVWVGNGSTFVAQPMGLVYASGWTPNSTPEL